MKIHFDSNGNVMDVFSRAAALAPMLHADNFYEAIKYVFPESTETLVSVEHNGAAKLIKHLMLLDAYGVTLTLSEEGTMYVDFFTERNKICVSLNTSGCMLEYKDKIFGLDRKKAIESDYLEDTLNGDDDTPYFDPEDIKLDIPFLLIGGISEFMEAVSPQRNYEINGIRDIAESINNITEHSDVIAGLLINIGSMTIGKPVLLSRQCHTRAVPFLFKGDQQPMLSVSIDADMWIAFHDEGAVFGYAFGCGSTALSRCIGSEDEMHDDVIVFSSIEPCGFHAEHADKFIMHNPVISGAIENLVKSVFSHIKK